MLQYHFNWKTLSAMAGVTWWNFYFRLFPGAIKSPQVVEFLEHLMRHLPGKLLIIWDGRPSHPATWCGTLFANSADACGWNSFRPMLRNSIRWSICGRTGNNMNYPTSARVPSPS